MKFNFLINKTTDVLIVDDGYSGLQIKHKKFYLLKNEIYLFYLFKSLLDSIKKINFSINLIKENYFKNLIKSFNPKIAIGHDLNYKIFKIKKNFPNIITIAYQFGYLFKGQDEETYAKILKNNTTNYFLAFNNNSKKFINKFVKTKVIIAGSVKNNETIIKKRRIKKYDFCFISQYRPLSKKIKNNVYILYERKNMKKILSRVVKYCDENNKTLLVALSANRTDKLRYNFINEEINFFRSISSKILFFPKKNSLEIVSLCKVVICYNSNLGAEILAQGSKVIFFSISKYAKFLFKKKYNICNIESIEHKLVNKRLNNVLNITNSNWEKYCKKIQLINYDKKNKLLNKLIHKLLNILK